MGSRVIKQDARTDRVLIMADMMQLVSVLWFHAFPALVQWLNFLAFWVVEFPAPAATQACSR
jgi:hypothetical protein